MPNKKKKKDKLSFELKNLWTVYSQTEEKTVMTFADEYKTFLKLVKTEREAVDFFRENAKKAGYKCAVSTGKSGKKLYYVNRDHAIAIVRKGKKPVSQGVRIIGAHLDSPRLDLKQKPFFEDSNLSMLKTHYYGGIKKYQWLSRPLAIHGIVIKGNGDKVKISVGEDPGDPVFVIPDLLPHLAKKVQYSKGVSELVSGEQLKILAGQKEVKSEEDKKKLTSFLLELLHSRYGIVQEDFVSADLEVVPADDPRDVGFDRSMVGGYGQDDRVCAYTAFRGMLDSPQPKYTSIAFLIDKEEIGSDGATGAQSNWLADIIADLLQREGKVSDHYTLSRTMHLSEAISADVNAAVNPLFKEVHDVENAAISGYGIVITKFTGSGGKFSSNEATAEFTAKIRNIFNKAKVQWQFGELGKVDEGGGGTIAKHISKWGIHSIDAGPGLLGMHSPFEIVSKADLWETYKGYSAFFSAE